MLRIFNLINSESWDELLEFDELTREMRNNRVFCGFTAAKPTFPPTFKRTKKNFIKVPPPNSKLY